MGTFTAQYSPIFDTPVDFLNLNGSPGPPLFLDGYHEVSEPYDRANDFGGFAVEVRPGTTATSVAPINKFQYTPRPSRSISTRPGSKASMILGMSENDMEFSKRNKTLRNAKQARRNTTKPTMKAVGMFSLSSLAGVSRVEPVPCSRPATSQASRQGSGQVSRQATAQLSRQVFGEVSRCPSREEELKSPKTPKSPEISSPTNFKHITHTRPHDFRKMGAASENDLLAEFSAVRAAQTSRQHVHGMKLSDLSSRNSVAEYAASVPSLSSDSSRSSIHNPRTSAPLTKRHMRPIRSKESFSLPFRDGHCRYRAVEPRTPSGPPSSPADLCTAQDVGYTPLCLPPHVGQSLLVEPAHDRSEDHPGYSFQPDASAHGVQDAAHANAYFHAQTTTDDDGQWQTPIVPQYNYHAALWSVDEERNSLDRSRPTSTMNTGLCTQLPLPSVTRKPLNPTYTQSMRPSIAMSNFKFPENTKAPPRSNMRYDFVHMEPKENRQGSLNRSSLTEGLFSSWTTDSDTGSEVGDEVPIIEKPPHLVTNQKAEEQHPARPSNTRSKSFPEPPSHPPPTLPLPAIPMPSSEPSESSESSPVSENPASKDPLPSLASYREPTGLKVSAAVAMLETKTDPTHAASKDRLAVAESRPRQTQAKQKPDVHKIQTTQAGTVAPVTVASAPLEGSMTRQAEAMSPDVADLQPEMRPDASPIMRRRGNSVKSVRFKDDMCTFRDIETPQNPEPEPIPAYNHVQANLEDLQQTLLKLELEMSRPLRDGYVDKVLKPAVPAFAVGKAEAGQSKKRKTQATEMPAILPRTSSLPQKATRHHRGGSSDGSMTLPPGSPQPAVSAVTA